MSLQEPKSKKRKELEEDEEIEGKAETEDEDDEGEERSDFKTMKNDDGDSYFELSNKRRITIRSFRGKVLVDIREVGKICQAFYLNKRCLISSPQVYEKDGKFMPGKKGIALNEEQYKMMRNLIKSGTIDTEVKNLM